MPNQFEAPKVVLAKQAQFPKQATLGTPVAPLGEGLSGILSSIAAILPEIPAMPAGLPGFPALPTGAPQFAQPPMVTEFIKSIEAGLPGGLPKLGQGGGQTVRGQIVEGRPPVSVATRGSL